MGQLADWLDQAMTEELAPRGFQRVRLRKWVREKVPHIHEIFEFYALKSWQNTPLWGFSLICAPSTMPDHTLALKRTLKSARCDISYDPIWQQEGKVLDWHTMWHVPGLVETSYEKVREVVRVCVNRAMLDFIRIESLADLEKLFEGHHLKVEAERAKHPDQGPWSLLNLAWGLNLIALGDSAKGEERIAVHCDTHEIDPQHRYIAAAREAAKQIARESGAA